MNNRFVVVDDFHSDELQSDYVAGLSYEAKEGDTKLLELIPKWLDEGKIKMERSEARMTGTAEVSDKE